VPTAILEINRSLLLPPWPPASGTSLIEITGGLPAANYMAPATGIVVSTLLRPWRPLTGVET
jgi:hypothetical protein